VILNFLRTGQVFHGALTKEQVVEEANFYGVPIDDNLDLAIEAEMVLTI